MEKQKIRKITFEVPPLFIVQERQFRKDVERIGRPIDNSFKNRRRK